MSGARSDEELDRLLGGWLRHVGRLAAEANRRRLLAVGRSLLGRYAEPHRHYHDGRHLAQVLATVALLSEHAVDLSCVVAAAWWHDAVYDVPAAPGANERASADLAGSTLELLGADPSRSGEVARLVRLTSAHDPGPGDRDGAVLSDADLAVLAADAAHYETYAADVRAEHAHLPDEAFAAGRSAVLRSLLARPRLYRTATAYDAFEAPARVNLAAELGHLTHR